MTPQHQPSHLANEKLHNWEAFENVIYYVGYYGFQKFIVKKEEILLHQKIRLHNDCGPTYM